MINGRRKISPARIAATIVLAPIILLWAAVLSLYLPPVQKVLIEYSSSLVEENSPFSLSIERVSLTPPLKLTLSNYSLASDGKDILHGKKLSLDIAPLPLFAGKIEVNNLALEQTSVDTRDIIDGTRISGRVGYITTVARSIDLKNERATVKMLHAEDGDIDITLRPTTEPADSTGPAAWEILLKKGNIKNLRLTLQAPADSIYSQSTFGQLKIEGAEAMLHNASYNINSLLLQGGSTLYGTTPQTATSAGGGFSASDINLQGSNLAYHGSNITGRIEAFNFTGDNGTSIADAKGSFSTDSTSIMIAGLRLKSGHGSTIEGAATLPTNFSHKNSKDRIAATLAAHINKRDLYAFIPQESLATYPDSLLDTHVSLHGSPAKITIDSLWAAIPSVASLHISGELQKITDSKKRDARLNISGRITDINTLANEKGNGSKPIAIDGEGSLRGSNATADITIKGEGEAHIMGTYNIEKNFYDSKAELDGFSVAASLPSVPIEKVTMNAALSGSGSDIFDKATFYQLIARIDTLQYSNSTFENITISAFQANSFSLLSLLSQGTNLQLSVMANTHINREKISNSTSISVEKAALHKLALTDTPFDAHATIKIDATTDTRESHTLKIQGSDIAVNYAQRKFAPGDIYADIATAPGASHLHARSGDLKADAEISYGYKEAPALWEKVKYRLWEAMHGDTVTGAASIAHILPRCDISFKCGENNILAEILSMQGFGFSAADLQCSCDTLSGINARAELFMLSIDEVKLDTLKMSITQEADVINYYASVKDIFTDDESKQQSLLATLSGNIAGNVVGTHLKVDDSKGLANSDISATTTLTPQGIAATFAPRLEFLGTYITLNNDNFIATKDTTLAANIKATDSRGTTIHFYTAPDSTGRSTMNLDFAGIDLEQITNTLPFAPDIHGTLQGNVRYRHARGRSLFTGNINGEQITYEGTLIGNEAVKAAYIPTADGRHLVSFNLLHNGNEIAMLRGNYNSAGSIKGRTTLTRFPLSVINAFTKGSSTDVYGYLDGEIAIDGPLLTPRSDGYIKFDSVQIDAPLLGSRLRMADERVEIKDSKIIFDAFNIYAKGNTPFKIDGDIYIENIANPIFDIRMWARNYELVNAPRRKASIVYGKLYLDINSRITGPLQSLNVAGEGTILDNSNITYVMHNSGIAANNELDGLVEFVSFGDSTTTATITAPQLGNITLAAQLHIEENAWINADLDPNRNNYVSLQGGGTLNLGYTSEQGLTMTGRYTLNNGEMKYTLPVIPLKTFSISEGSYINWTGDIMNPGINITALERVVAPVASDNGTSLPVIFDVGLTLTNTLDNMGLSFTLRAPENATIQDELNTLDTETMNKYAVTMLITGAYVGSKGGLTVSSALTSFIDAKINDLASNTMKNTSINVGITDVENSTTGASYTNYNFSFAKRFWNDRFTIVIGGEVNSGETPEEEQSFINNVSLEWKISPTSNRYLRIFYDKNYESILEGEITETGVGYLYKRKLESLSELLFFKKREKKEQKTTGQ